MEPNGIESIDEHARSAFVTDNGPPYSAPDRRFHADKDRRDMPCGCHKVGSRNLVVCIDGTSNQFGDKNTNVIELYNLIMKQSQHNQRTWYNSGIGTYVQPSAFSPAFYKQWLFHKIDTAIAWDFKKTVLGAYRWLSENYEEGDCIFLFGFSRGAYQVRVLSAMIEKVGLIYKGNELQIPFAYQLYADPTSGDANSDVTQVGQASEGTSTGGTSKAARFKSAFSVEDVRVHFVGVWDTVSSIGAMRATNMHPLTIEGMKHVCYFRHALALDERRVKFLPEYAYGGSTEPALATPEGKVDEGMAGPHQRELQNANVLSNKDKDMAKPTASLPHTKEVWFAGTHSDIGGGNVQNKGMDRSRPPLRWMVFEAGAAGLRTALFKRELSAQEQITIKESLTGFWWNLFEWLPFKRLTYTRKANGHKKTTRLPHRSKGRKIHPGQKIHSSLLRADPATWQEYTPKARPAVDEGSFWETLRSQGTAGHLTREWLELDLSERIDNIIEQLITEDDDAALLSLHHIAISSDARQNLYDAVIEALNREDLTSDVRHRLLRSTLDVLKSYRDSPDFQLSPAAKVRFLLELCNAKIEGDRKTARDFMISFTRSCEVLHIPLAMSVWSGPSGRRCAALGSSNVYTVQIWDVETGQPLGDSFRGHTDAVRSVAFSSNGRHVVSGSDDRTIRIWDVETGRPVGEPLRGHTASVRSVAFLSDGTHVVSGSSDDTVRIWDVETGKQVGGPLRGHTRWVESVISSPDRKHIFSGSADSMVLIWNVETEERVPVGNPLQGHTNSVLSVASSLDGKHIVSGSHDNTVQIWEVETGMPVGVPLQGHRGAVNSVVFSSDGKHVASGSDDRTVRIWDVETGSPVGKPLRGHTECVRFVAFLPDGKHIVSSDQRTVRIWDLEHPKYNIYH